MINHTCTHSHAPKNGVQAWYWLFFHQDSSHGEPGTGDNEQKKKPSLERVATSKWWQPIQRELKGLSPTNIIHKARCKSQEKRKRYRAGIGGMCARSSNHFSIGTTPQGVLAMVAIPAPCPHLGNFKYRLRIIKSYFSILLKVLYFLVLFQQNQTPFYFQMGRFL